MRTLVSLGRGMRRATSPSGLVGEAGAAIATTTRMARVRRSVFQACGGGRAAMLALLVVVVGGAGCGEQAPTPAPSGPGGDAGLGGAGGSTPVVPAAVWNDSSQSIAVTCSSYWTGSTRFVASRAQMTEEQLAMHTKLDVVESRGPC